MMGRLTFLLSFLVFSAHLNALEFDHYHSQDEIGQYLRQVAVKHPELFHFAILGHSAQQREIAYLKVGSGDFDAKPGIYLLATHHGDEKSSTESALGVIDYLEKHRDDPWVAKLLASYVLYIQPLVNPDGHAAHTRSDSVGRDPNRDYAYPNRDEEHSFKIPEIQLVKNLQDQFAFRAAISYHSGMEAVLLPWCYARRNTEDHSLFFTLFKPAAQAMGIPIYRSSVGYATYGEYIDYAYMKHGTLAVTLEVSRPHTPAETELQGVVHRARLGTIAFLEAMLAYDRGEIPIAKADSDKTAREIFESLNLPSDWLE